MPCIIADTHVYNDTPALCLQTEMKWRQPKSSGSNWGIVKAFFLLVRWLLLFVACNM